MMFYFGYAKHSKLPSDNPTAFFEFGDDTPAHIVNQAGYFEEHNDIVIDWISKLNELEMEEFKYVASDLPKNVEILTFETSLQAARPMTDWVERKFYGKAKNPCK